MSKPTPTYQSPPTPALTELANELGIEVSYVDITGATVIASDEALLSVMRALGVDIESTKGAGAALAAHRVHQARQLIDPVHVIYDGEALELRTKSQPAGAVIKLTLTLEDGTKRDLDQPLLPAGLPLGYHEVAIAVGGESATSRIISAPRRAHPGRYPRTWGLFTPLYALRSEHDWGIGDLGDMRDLLEIVGEDGGGLVGSTPLLATFLETPFEPSPYMPVSRLFWNEEYVELELVPEFQSPRVAALARDPEIQDKRSALCATKNVDHRAVYALKRTLLEACAAELFERGGPRLAAFEKWRDSSGPLLSRYAGFRAAVELEGRPAPGARLPIDTPEARYHQYVQWCMAEQLIALDTPHGAGLYLDLPLGVHPDGFDTWEWQHLFLPGASIGAPPDPLAPGGQNWVVPALNPTRLREDGYSYTIACIQHLFRHAATVRIDHVMSLHRLFFIPTGLDTSEGVYVRYRADEQWAIVCLESHRHGVQVVGEDLGTVPGAVRRAMTEHDVRRTYVLQFELDLKAKKGTHAFRPAPAGAVATLDTHDTPTWAATWKKFDPAARATLLRYLFPTGTAAVDEVAPQAVAAAAALVLATSAADAVVTNLEDTWGEIEPQNVPGTGSFEAPNWQRKAARTIEQVRADRDLRANFRAMTDARTKAADMTSPARDTASPTVRYDVSLLTDDDIFLFNEGTHNQLHHKLGAHPLVSDDGVAGMFFAVWAPNAERVSVIGDFNFWNDQENPLPLAQSDSGIWQGFVPGVTVGETYKFHISSRWNGYQVEKADPFARRAELAPRTGSITWESSYEWADDEFMAERGDRISLNAPVSVYELHAGSFMRVPEEENRFLTYRELAPRLIEHVQRMGFTHVQFMPLMEHPFYGSWGYQTTGYFAPTCRYGTPDDLKYLVDQLHQAEIGVLLDWVPSHFPTDQHGLGYFDGTHLFEHADERQGFHPDWKSFIFNYSRNEVRSFLLSSAMYWLEEYHVDGLRVDAVASILYLDYSREHGEWIPNIHGGRENLEAISFLRRMNEDIYAGVPGVQTIAEESTAWGGVSRPTSTGGLGFGMKWDMGWMHDTLQYFSREAVHRRYHQNELTFRQIYAYTENFMLPLSHDEVVHGKGSLIAHMPGDPWQQFANLRLLFSYMFTLPGKKLLFMGSEFAQGSEWNHNESLDWHLLDAPPHRGVAQLITDLNAVYRNTPALHELDCESEGFAWVDTNDAENSVFSYLRFARTEGEPPALVVLNATPVTRNDYRIGVPSSGRWKELLNSDASQYWGGGQGNLGGVEADAIAAHGHDWSVNLTLPPLGCVIMSPEGGKGTKV